MSLRFLKVGSSPDRCKFLFFDFCLFSFQPCTLLIILSYFSFKLLLLFVYFVFEGSDGYLSAYLSTVYNGVYLTRPYSIV